MLAGYVSCCPRLLCCCLSHSVRCLCFMLPKRAMLLTRSMYLLVMLHAIQDSCAADSFTVLAGYVTCYPTADSSTVLVGYVSCYPTADSFIVLVGYVSCYPIELCCWLVHCACWLCFMLSNSWLVHYVSWSCFMLSDRDVLLTCSLWWLVMFHAIQQLTRSLC